MAEAIISPGVFKRETDLTTRQPEPIEAGTAFVGPTVKGPVDIPVTITSYSQYVQTFGDVFDFKATKQEYLTSIAVRDFFSQGGNVALVTRVAEGTYEPATGTEIPSTDSGVDNLGYVFVLETLGAGEIYNSVSVAAGEAYDANADENSDGSLKAGTSDNLRFEIVNVNAKQGTFTLNIRRGDDSTNTKIILETFNNLSLDPNSPNYIERVIGNQKKVYNSSDGGYIETIGDFINRSNLIRVEEVNLTTLNYLLNDGTTVNEDESEVSFEEYLPVDGTIGGFSGGEGGVGTTVKMFDKINASNTQGLTATGGEVAAYTNALDILDNKEDFKFKVLVAPGLIGTIHAATVKRLILIAEGRGDCIAVIDTEQYGATVSGVAGEGDSYNSSFAATYWPWLQMRSTTGKLVYVPASTVIPGVYAFTDSISAPWFAPAGLTRGSLGGVTQPERKLKRSQRDTLYASKINPIAQFPGQGIAIYGQKTLQTRASALDRINVRRLLIELKEFIGNQARTLVFENNTIATRNRFLSSVNPFLESVVQRQGLFAFRVVMDETNNTNDTIDRNQLVGQIQIQPARTVEFIILDFTLEPTGAAFGE